MTIIMAAITPPLGPSELGIGVAVPDGVALDVDDVIPGGGTPTNTYSN